MATARSEIFKTATPNGWSYTFDRTDVQDGVVDNTGTAASAAAALDLIKPLIAALPGTLARVQVNITTFEAGS